MVAFSDGVTTALVAQVDTEELSGVTAGLMREAIAKATGIDRDAVLLHASHTHDGANLAYGVAHGSVSGHVDGGRTRSSARSTASTATSQSHAPATPPSRPSAT